jgi:hypothetical protein
MCPGSVAAAGAFYVKGAAFVEQGAVESHICHWYVAVGLLLRECLRPGHVLAMARLDGHPERV